jgi:hypothetical protein
LLLGFGVAVGGVSGSKRQCQTHGKNGEQLFHDVPLCVVKSGWFLNPAWIPAHNACKCNPDDMARPARPSHVGASR